MPVIEFHPVLKEIIKFHNSIYSFFLILRNKVKGNPAIFEKSEIALITEAFVVKQVADWDNFIENVLAICLLVDTSKLSEHLDLDLPKKISFDNAKAILNGLNYFDIKSSGDIKGTAKKIHIESNNPFLTFEGELAKKVDEMYAMRNYIAHKSKRSKKRLKAIYKSNYNIEDFIEPGVFFENKYHEHGDQWEAYFAAYLGVATEIWKHMDRKSYDKVFEDTTSQEGWLKAFGKMKYIFLVLSKQIDEKDFPEFPEGLIFTK